MQFNPDDVRKVAQAVIDHPLTLHECRSDYYSCSFCGGTQNVYYRHGHMLESTKKFPHDLDCPVLVAQDLLTNQKLDV